MRSRRTAASRPARIDLSGKLDRHEAEALRLEARRLARRYGVEISDILVEKPEQGSKLRT